MAKYQKLPVIIEAFKAGDTSCKAPKWFINGMLDKTVRVDPIGFSIKTLEGRMKANPGDYIIQGVNGELYPCKAEIFEKTYRKVEEGEKTND